MTVHEKIRLIRQAKGLTQEEVAEKLDMSVTGYGDIERGDSDIKLSRLKQIADLFEIKLSELMELSEKGVLNFACEQKESNWHIGSTSMEHQQLKIELEKQKIINEQKDKEIAYLKELNALLKEQNS